MTCRLAPIHKHAASDNLAGIKAELANGTPVDLRDPNEALTPLMHAVSSHHADTAVARFLIESGADVNSTTEKHAPVLSFAIRAGEVQKVGLLLRGGADVKCVRPHGYDALIDAMYTPLSESERLSLLSLLINHGANLDGMSTYSESALRIASRTGQFRVVRLLLDSGTNPEPLRWTPLMLAVALGSLEDLERESARGAEPFTRDSWERTPWLLSLQTNDVAKARRLLKAGANRSDRGRCGMTPLMYPIERDHAQMLGWLLSEGFAPNETDEQGTSALAAAVANDAIACARMLLEAGANVQKFKDDEPIIKRAKTLQMARLLVSHGADLNDIDDEVRAELTRLPHDKVVDVSRETYLEQKLRRFGTANPQPMNLPFWVAMVKSGEYAYPVRQYFEDQDSEDQGPVWCFQRFGKSITELPDGRIIEIAGEHEDYYDPDFCIYNDVVVHRGDGTFDIYGYPRECFPPTDFHTATLIDKCIYIIGNLGYPTERQLGTTQVFRLDTQSLAMHRLHTIGTSPGWLNSHKARVIAPNLIRISGGKICAQESGKEPYTDNPHDYVLDLDQMAWSRCG